MVDYIKRKLGNLKVFFLYHFYKYKYVKPLDLSFFDGKTVAIVGPADSALEKKNGSYIDSFDVVIRINKGIDMADRYPEYLGTKTDILVHGLFEKVCGKLDKPLWTRKNIAFVIYPENLNYHVNTARLMPYFRTDKTKLLVWQVTREFYEDLKVKLNNTHPNSGFSAIYYVMNSKAKRLFITGFTFYKTPYLKGYVNEIEKQKSQEELTDDGYHNPNNDFELFKKLIKESSISLELDNQLQMILYSEKVV